MDGLLGRIHAPPKPEATPEAAPEMEAPSEHEAADLPTATNLVANQPGLLTGLLPVHDAEAPLVEDGRPSSPTLPSQHAKQYHRSSAKDPQSAQVRFAHGPKLPEGARGPMHW